MPPIGMSLIIKYFNFRYSNSMEYIDSQKRGGGVFELLAELFKK